MLKISKLADYATSIMNFLVMQSGELFSAGEIAKRLHVPAPVVSKILKLLHEAELLISVRGAEGGYRLARTAPEITLLEVITAVDGAPALTECSSHNNCCAQSSVCITKHNWQFINRIILSTLQNITLEDMAKPLTLRAQNKTVLQEVTV